MKASRIIPAALIAGAAVSSSAFAQSSMHPVDDVEVIGAYVAYIGPQDLYNSDGERLSHPWQIIRQDRANFHRFLRRDPGDEPDRFFASAENRAAMETMLRNGEITPAAARDVVGGGTTILVEVLGSGGMGTGLRITTSR